MGEVFRNCADFKLGSANDVASTAAPATTLEPEPEPEPEPESTLAPTTTTTTTTTASSPTTAAPATTTVAPTVAPDSGCVDVQGTECSHCMASNNVCYAQPKSWCDTFSYRWCGATSLLQQDASPVLRRKARTQGFLAPSFP